MPDRPAWRRSSRALPTPAFLGWYTCGFTRTSGRWGRLGMTTSVGVTIQAFGMISYGLEGLALLLRPSRRTRMGTTRLTITEKPARTPAERDANSMLVITPA